MGGKGKRKTHRCGDLRSIETGAQNPDWDLDTSTRNGLNLLARLHRLEVGHQLGNIVRKAVGGRWMPAERPHRQLVGAGSSAQPEIDSPGEERGEGSELLGDHQWRVVREHDSTGTNPYARGSPSDMSD